VRNFRVELQAVDLAVDIRHGREWRIAGRANRREPFRQSLHAIAVAHPHLEPSTKTREQRIRAREIHLGVAILPMRGGCDRAAELRRQRLHAVADAKHGHAPLGQCVGNLRRAGRAHGLRAAAENDAGGRELRNLFRAGVVRQDLAVDAHLAHTARDQLRVLAAEIDDEDALAVRILALSRRLRCGGHYWDL